jgi:hypothetical protein
MRAAASLLDGLASLADKSLVRTGTAHADRFTMLETIPEFALERLEVSGEAAEIRRAHADYFKTLAMEAEPHLIGEHQKGWLDRLETEHDNPVGALREQERVVWKLEAESTGIATASSQLRKSRLARHSSCGRLLCLLGLYAAGGSGAGRIAIDPHDSFIRGLWPRVEAHLVSVANTLPLLPRSGYSRIPEAARVGISATSPSITFCSDTYGGAMPSFGPSNQTITPAGERTVTIRREKRSPPFSIMTSWSIS